MTDPYNQSVAGQAQTDIGLRDFMRGTYRYMAMALAVTVAVAFGLAQLIPSVPVLAALLANKFIILGFIIAIPFLFGGVARKLPSMSLGGVQTFLFSFAAFMGFFMAAVAYSFNAAVLLKIFFMTVAMFGALSLFGYTTQRNLWTYAKYAIAAFMAYVAIMVLGMFFPAIAPTGMFETVLSGVALLAISVIIAWENQHLKQIYYSMAGNAAMLGKLSAYGAASLLLSFINMFNLLLNLFGSE